MPTNLKDERRADRRYPLAAELDYRIAEGRGQVKTGRGKTINISSSSIFFKPEEPLPAGTPIELSIPWPARLDGTVALSLLVTVTTVQVRDECVAVRIAQYDFRTRSNSRPKSPWVQSKSFFTGHRRSLTHRS